MNVTELNFDEEITLDHTSLPEDDTEGADYRDIQLSEMLYANDWEDDIDNIPDLLDNQGV